MPASDRYGKTTDFSFQSIEGAPLFRGTQESSQSAAKRVTKGTPRHSPQPRACSRPRSAVKSPPSSSGNKSSDNKSSDTGESTAAVGLKRRLTDTGCNVDIEKIAQGLLVAQAVTKHYGALAANLEAVKLDWCSDHTRSPIKVPRLSPEIKEIVQKLKEHRSPSNVDGKENIPAHYGSEGIPAPSKHEMMRTSPANEFCTDVSDTDNSTVLVGSPLVIRTPQAPAAAYKDGSESPVCTPVDQIKHQIQAEPSPAHEFPVSHPTAPRSNSDGSIGSFEENSLPTTPIAPAILSFEGAQEIAPVQQEEGPTTTAAPENGRLTRSAGKRRLVHLLDNNTYSAATFPGRGTTVKSVAESACTLALLMLVLSFAWQSPSSLGVQYALKPMGLDSSVFTFPSTARQVWETVNISSENVLGTWAKLPKWTRILVEDKPQPELATKTTAYHQSNSATKANTPRQVQPQVEKKQKVATETHDPNPTWVGKVAVKPASKIKAPKQTNSPEKVSTPKQAQSPKRKNVTQTTEPITITERGKAVVNNLKAKAAHKLPRSRWATEKFSQLLQTTMRQLPEPLKAHIAAVPKTSLAIVSGAALTLVAALFMLASRIMFPSTRAGHPDDATEMAFEPQHIEEPPDIILQEHRSRSPSPLRAIDEDEVNEGMEDARAKPSMSVSRSIKSIQKTLKSASRGIASAARSVTGTQEAKDEDDDDNEVSSVRPLHRKPTTSRKPTGSHKTRNTNTGTSGRRSMAETTGPASGSAGNGQTQTITSNTSTRRSKRLSVAA